MVVGNAIPGQVAAADSLSPSSALWTSFRKRRSGMIGLVALSLIVVGVIFVPVLFPNPYDVMNPDPLSWHAPAGHVDPSNGHLYLLGSDMLGRDNFTLLFQAGRLSLITALLPALLVMIIGFIVGVTAGYYGGWLDSLLMRVTDFLIALPLLPAYIISIRLVRANPRATPLGDDVLALMLAIVVTFALYGWMGIGRLVRGLTLTLRTQSFVEAARALGASNRHVILRHLLPNTLGPVLVAGILIVGDFVVLEAILAYFGLSFHDHNQGTVVSWGNMLASNETLIGYARDLNPFSEIRGYLSIFPSVLIFITMLSINLVGDALLDALDPRRHVYHARATGA